MVLKVVDMVGFGSGMPWRLGGLAFVISLVTTCSSASAVPFWFGQPYDYVAIDQDIRSVLAEFGRNLGVPVVFSDAVRGKLRGKISGKEAGTFLNEITDSTGLVWYFDGAILHVSTTSELGTRVLDADAVGADAVRNEMQRLGLADQRFALRAVGRGNALAVSGPPAFIAAAEQVAKSIAPKPEAPRDDVRVRVFRGGFAAGPAVSSEGSDAVSQAPEARR